MQLKLYNNINYLIDANMEIRICSVARKPIK